LLWMHRVDVVRLAGDERAGLVFKIKDRHRVAPFMQPAAGHVIGLLRTYLPDAAHGMTIDPDQALTESAHIEIGVSDTTEVECSLVKRRPRG
jgi:hypothetical protein